jgi:hypothetical protein
MMRMQSIPSPFAGEGPGGGTDEGRSSALPPSPSLPHKGGEWPRYFRRGPWENAAVALIGLGIVMLMQPFAMALFTWSFVTILVGTAMFVIVSHFPE